MKTGALSPERRTRAIVWLIYALAVIAAAIFCTYKFKGLGYRYLDFPLYLEFSAKLLDPELTNRLAANSEGFNYFGITDVEGKYSLNQAIHFELVKYVYAVIYRVFRHPAAIFVFLALAYFAPVLYYAHIRPLEGRAQRAHVLLFSLAYVLFPSALNMTAFDMRPRILLTPALLLAALSIYFRRPLLERVLLFGLLFAIREEALIFGLILIAFNFLRERGESGAFAGVCRANSGRPKVADGRGRRISTGLLGLVWLGGALANYLYYRWTGYTHIDNVLNPFNLLMGSLPLLVVFGAFVVGYLGFALYVWFRRPEDRRLRFLLEVLTYAFLFIPLLFQSFKRYQFGEDELADRWVDSVRGFLLSPQHNLLLLVGLVLFALVWDFLRRENLRRYLNLGLLAVVLLSLALDVQVYPARFRRYADRARDSEVVFAFRDSVDRLSSGILVDYLTHQAFYDFEQIYVYERLRWDLVEDREARYFPHNADLLKELLAEQIDYIAVSGKGRADVDGLLQDLNIEPLPVSDEAGYVIYALP